MACHVYFENHLLSDTGDAKNVSSLQKLISQRFFIPECDLYATVNGKLVQEDKDLGINNACTVRFVTRLVGGKGGFGSMLRAIGAQIEKTTNREACRDLSGRRLRDINEEKRLRKWLEGQADREQEAADRKKKKLERLVAEPKIEVDLKSYEKERQDLPERVSAAVDAGWEVAGSSGESLKRKAVDPNKAKKKKKLWIDAELSDCSSLSDSDDDDDEGDKEDKSPIVTVSTDSGNESDRLSEAKV